MTEPLEVTMPMLRYKVCNSCPQQSARGVCKACHCIIRFKANVASAKCPLGKWPAELTPEAIAQYREQTK